MDMVATCPSRVESDAASWLDKELLCVAGRREMHKGRYLIRSIRNGKQLRSTIKEFLTLVEDYKKIGFLAIFDDAPAIAGTVRDELLALGEILSEAGFIEMSERALSGFEMHLPIEVQCPVTGKTTVYPFFAVAFCRNANRPDDELYDVSLSGPWTMINVTSDALAFAMLVRDCVQKKYDCEVYEIKDSELCRQIFERAIAAWQNMSVRTITEFSKLSRVPSRAVGLSKDQRHWSAPHQDPCFAELDKADFIHEMPVLYARNIANKWFGALFCGQQLDVGREGQAGGIKQSDFMEVSNELYCS